MRAIVDLVDSFTGIVRFIVVAMMVVGLAITLLMTAGVSYVAPKVAENMGERATQLGERAITEARDARRERELAQDGWGYGNSGSGQERASSRSSSDVRQGYGSGSEGDGWGDEAR